MHRILKARREEIKQLRKDRDAIKAERKDLWKKALGINGQLEVISDDAKVLHIKQKEKAAEIAKLAAENKEIWRLIREKWQDIRARKSTKRTLFVACREKKAQIIEKDKLIMKAQDDIKGIKGSHRDW